ncbi:hypothetical protein Taro_027748 [Colocasia esculenta]|uniref:Radical SAM core domain-containing protein n=1 Tax=Colocasia esculenta TaxID=4460 RepID=A0A843VND7_COLES|nr:hypothetical protein [Colocasia esculenta]
MASRSIFDAGALRGEFESAGISTHFLPLIWRYVLRNPTCELEEVPSLPSAAYPLLRAKFRPMTSSLASAVDSGNGTTTKLLVRLQSGSFVEAVIMRYDTRLGKYDGKPRPGGPRSTLCVSSQVGCKMGCKFCATGTMGFKTNLSSGEIVEQLVHALRLSNIRNVVFMGMGEPLNNYSAVVEAVKIIIGSPFQLSPKRVTISTVGNSLSNNACCSGFSNNTIDGFIAGLSKDMVNDQEQHAHQLGKLLEKLQVLVIPLDSIGATLFDGEKHMRWDTLFDSEGELSDEQQKE